MYTARAQLPTPIIKVANDVKLSLERHASFLDIGKLLSQMQSNTRGTPRITLEEL